MRAATQTLCVECGQPGVQTIDSRVTSNNWRLRRRRCSSCQHKWSTYEIEVEVLDGIIAFLDIIQDMDTELTKLSEVAKSLKYVKPHHTASRGIPVEVHRTIKEMFSRRDAADE